MARLSAAGSAVPADHKHLDLTRMIARLQTTLVTPDAAQEYRLRISELEREKVGKNLEYASNLLLKLEQDAQNIRVLSKKQEMQTDLSRKRDALARLQERLADLNDAGNIDDSSEGEDLIGEDTPSEGADDTQVEDTTRYSPPIPQPQIPSSTSHSSSSPPSTLRNRRTAPTEPDDSSFATTTSSHIPTTKESLLSHNRAEQESLTSSLLTMASALRESSLAFATSLEEEKDILENTASGMEKNEDGLRFAGERMGMLRRVSEGRGWLGRMLMYAWIAGLMVIALLVVFVMPKLRF
ncbi:synaptobrevin [Glarea lozoyensis ATCC 20868]|uniref:Synaptobrevin n=1 Tax=Glarea lozoyensis (strain ATCC 20868 / MF5171) TaxID=1116229 RepID=S3D430_GLAL2|nr:synaptobrevin [Glarea lozoyensis ATCC 20868]EPE32575.1 synaptobrevin [Glarea lozoyensis ATCC 20868]